MDVIGSRSAASPLSAAPPPPSPTTRDGIRRRPFETDAMMVEVNHTVFHNDARASLFDQAGDARLERSLLRGTESRAMSEALEQIGIVDPQSWSPPTSVDLEWRTRAAQAWHPQNRALRGANFSTPALPSTGGGQFHDRQSRKLSLVTFGQVELQETTQLENRKESYSLNDLFRKAHLLGARAGDLGHGVCEAAFMIPPGI
eukprot:COSAG04_NODE_2412_length_4181_cov_3.810877_7_plen_201_part_00